jgi:hypothetical protein
VVDLPKHHLIDEIDRTAALIGAIFALALTICLALTIGRPIYITVGVLLFLACIGYLIIKKSVSSSTLSTLASVELSNRLHYTLNIVFFILFVSSIVCVCLRPDPYIRPLAYFVSIAFMVGVVAVEILFLPSSRSLNYLTLFKIASIGLSLELSQVLLFPSIVGVDPWYHQRFTLEILDAGHIPEGYGYSDLPLMHLMICSTSLLTGLHYKMATILSVSLSQVLCNMLFTFLLGDFVFNRKVGLLGSLLLVTANWHVNMGYWVIPNTMGSLFVLPILYLLLKVGRDHSLLGVLLAMLLMAASILTHTITALFISILLFTSWLVFKVHNRLHFELEMPVTFTIFALHTVGMLFWWTYISGDLATLAEIIRMGFSVSRFAGPAPSGIVQYASSLPFSEQLLSILGVFLFFAISLIGCLYMISRKFENPRSSIISIGGVVPLSLGFLALISGKSIIESRWWYFSQILLALPVAVALLLLCLSVKSKVGQSLLLMGLTFSLSLLMVLSPPVNLDNPAITENLTIRYAFTASELQAMETVSNIWSKEIGVDSYYYKVMDWSSYSVEDIVEQIYSRDYSAIQDMYVLIRREIVVHPFRFRAYTYKLDYDPNEALAAQRFSRVYDCGSVSGFVKPDNATSLQH